MFNKAEYIKESVSMDEVLRDFAGVESRRRRTNECPINGCQGKDGFSWSKKVFHCFICDSRGDVIGFVEQYLHCGFKEACAEINKKYHLYNETDKNGGLSFQESRAFSERQERKRQERRQKEERERRKNAALDEMYRLDANKIKYAPKSPDDELDPRFVEACQRLTIQEYIVDSEGW